MAIRIILIIFIEWLLFSQGFLLSSDAQDNLPQLVKKISSLAVSKMTYEKTGNPLRMGSGFLINEQGHIISNYHVLEGASRAEIKTFDKKFYNAPSILIEDGEGETEREAAIERFILLLKSDINDCKKEIEKHPKQSFGYECLGEAYREHGRYKDAIDSYKKAIQIAPNAAGSYKGLGKTYRAMRFYQNAIDNLKKAVSINFEDSEAHFLLGLTFHGIRDNSSAYKEYKILQKLDLEEANKLLNFITTNHSI